MTPLKVLIACECSGIVRDAFLRRGHDAISCDLKPSEIPGPHYQGDVLDLLGGNWDLMIAHPECTYLTNSAAWAFKDGPYYQKVKPGTLVGADRRRAREAALSFVRRLMRAEIPHIGIENPPGSIGTFIRKADQYIQPHQFGHDASKKTGLWLKQLPPLRPTRFVEPRMVDGRPRWGNQTDSGQNKLTPSDQRSTDRSRFWTGVADAMATQWPEFITGVTYE